jgi:hypothetical protein
MHAAGEMCRPKIFGFGAAPGNDRGPEAGNNGRQKAANNERETDTETITLTERARDDKGERLRRTKFKMVKHFNPKP